jgi:hypothetical protein
MKTNRFLVKYLKDKFGALIGRGLFSLVFKKENEDFVTIVSRDKAKECNAFFGIQHPDYPESEVLFPGIGFAEGKEIEEAEGYLAGRKLYPSCQIPKIYRMEYFPRVKGLKGLKGALKPDQWQLYLALRRVMNKVGFHEKNWDRIDEYRILFDEMGRELDRKVYNSAADGENTGKGAKYAEIMNSALDSLLNFGQSIIFEISPRNVAANSKGELVLLDCFFYREDLIEVRGI